ncbi:MAG: phosphate acyltransferase PlsX [Kiritimatiellia bacterium]
MRIAIDAMGGDRAPGAIVAGAVEAGRKIPSLSAVYLVGDSGQVSRELSKHARVPDKVQVKHASESIGMAEAPASAIRRKKDSSIGRAVDMIKKGEADAVVSAGNTGAVVVAAKLKLRAMAGVERPAIAAIMPTLAGPCVLIDAGANPDCSAGLLAQFAVMGSVYARVILGRPKPVVGLLNIGGEESKGNEITREAYRLLDRLDLNFRGNVEGNDLFAGETDVVVCDGFVGNIVLKTTESTARAIGQWMKYEFRKSPVRMFGTILLRAALRAMKRRIDPEMYGGAPLLGVNGVAIITHGTSSSLAIYHAIRVACEAVDQRLNEVIGRELNRVGVAK